MSRVVEQLMWYRRDVDVESERRKNAEIIVVRTRDQLSRCEAQYQA